MKRAKQNWARRFPKRPTKGQIDDLFKNMREQESIRRALAAALEEMAEKLTAAKLAYGDLAWPMTVRDAHRSAERDLGPLRLRRGDDRIIAGLWITPGQEK